MRSTSRRRTRRRRWVLSHARGQACIAGFPTDAGRERGRRAAEGPPGWTRCDREASSGDRSGAEEIPGGACAACRPTAPGGATPGMAPRLLRSPPRLRQLPHRQRRLHPPPSRSVKEQTRYTASGRRESTLTAARCFCGDAQWTGESFAMMTAMSTAAEQREEPSHKEICSTRRICGSLCSPRCRGSGSCLYTDRTCASGLGR